MHFRGPLVLKQFAVYTPGTGSSKKRSVRPSSHDRRHGHQQFHEHSKEIREIQNHAEEVKRQVGALVTATEPDGTVITFTNEYGGSAAATPAATTSTATVVPAAPSLAASSSAPAPAESEQMGTVTPVAASSASPSSAAPSAAASVNAGSGNWARQAYYSSDDGTADGVVFLNNMGGGASGVFNMYGYLLIFVSS